MINTKSKLSYRDSIHKAGRIWMPIAVILIFAVPAITCIVYNTWPDMPMLLKGLLGVVPIFWTVGTIEVITYVPMLGTGGSYLGFVTGNLSNLKVPCALNGMRIANVESGTDEGEVISTISIAVSSIVATVIIAVGVLLLSSIRPFIESAALQPAFDNILPALFGGLAVVYISKNFKIAIAPLLFMITLFVLVPSLAGSVGILVPVGAGIAILAARIMYKKGIL